MRKEEEIQRAIRAYQGAVDFADRLDRGATTPDNHHGNGNSREHASAASAYQTRAQASDPSSHLNSPLFMDSLYLIPKPSGSFTLPRNKLPLKCVA